VGARHQGAGAAVAGRLPLAEHGLAPQAVAVDLGAKHPLPRPFFPSQCSHSRACTCTDIHANAPGTGHWGHALYYAPDAFTSCGGTPSANPASALPSGHA